MPPGNSNQNSNQSTDHFTPDLSHDIGPDMTTADGRREVRKATAASAMGNMTEWFDYGVYAVAVTYITAHFFPTEGGTLMALATFALSFLVRPLGGLVWGPLGDKLGRKKILALTIIMMSLATFLIGVLPTYASIGVVAPVLLILLRMVQGFSTGGEYGGAATFMAEYAPDKKRGFFGSFLEFGTLGGFALGTAVMLFLQVILGEQAMMDFGWRIPFFLALPMGLIGLYLRSKLEDTPVFQEMEAAGETQEGGTLKQLIVDYWRPMLVMSGLVIALNVVNYTLLSYMPTYLETQIGLAPSASLATILIGEVAMMAVIPFAGSLSDKVGRKPMWYTSVIGLFVFALPMFWLMGQSFLWAIVGFAVLGLLYIPQLATITATFPAMFPSHVRFAGFAITYNVSTAIFGGTAAIVNEAAIDASGFLLFPAVYMMIACVIGFIAIRFMPETAGASLRGTDIPDALDTGILATVSADEKTTEQK
ncbi:MFS transporter [Glutamicibacter bergerei]|uniref:General substrate transporter Major facilitator superfamily protein n=1 Tax=Glutamicibacter ardleyensis TaxID=225894 RepID=A0ABQ2DN62_9MICC|nr:MFS transporter [Glutamicibacter sp. BW77]GGJ59548.1 general substrate transporter Major facilitator superfamily protein [Glutamicibacter ardleyensis]